MQGTFRRTFRRVRRTISGNTNIFKLKIIRVNLMPIDGSQFATARDRMCLRVLSRRLLYGRLVIATFIAIKDNRNSVLVIFLPIGLMTIRLRFPSRFFLKAYTINSKGDLSSGRVLPLIMRLDKKFRLNGQRPVFLAGLIKVFFCPHRLTYYLIGLFSIFRIREIRCSIIIRI